MTKSSLQISQQDLEHNAEECGEHACACTVHLHWQ